MHFWLGIRCPKKRVPIVCPNCLSQLFVPVVCPKKRVPNVLGHAYISLKILLYKVIQVVIFRTHVFFESILLNGYQLFFGCNFGNF